MPNYSDAELDAAWNGFQAQPPAQTSGPSDAELDQIWESYQGQQPQPQSSSDAREGLFANALQGAGYLFGGNAGTKIGAIPIALGQGIAALKNGGDFSSAFSNTFDNYVAEQIGQREQFAKENPKTAIAANIVGALAPLSVAGVAGAPVGALGGVSKEAAAAAPKLLTPARWLLAGPTAGTGAAALGGRLAWNATQGAIPGAINAPEGEGLTGALKGGALGTAIGAPFEALRGGAKIFANRAQAAKEEALGIRAAMKAREQPRGAFVTASGEVVPTSELGIIDEAVARQNPFEKAINVVEKDGRLKSNAPAKLEAELAGRAATAGSELGGLIRTADDLVSTASEQLGVKVKFKPNWKYAEDFIERGKDTGGQREALRKQLDAFKSEWQTKPGTFADLVGEKRTLTTSSNWSASQADKAQSGLARAVYRGYQESAEKAFDNIAKQGGRPELVGKFKDLNQKLWAYNLLSKPIAEKAAKGFDPLLNAVWPKTSFGKMVQYGSAGTLGSLMGNPLLGLAWPAARLLGAIPQAFPNTASKVENIIANNLAKVGAQENPAVRALVAALGSNQERSSFAPTPNMANKINTNSKVVADTDLANSKTSKIPINNNRTGADPISIQDLKGSENGPKNKETIQRQTLSATTRNAITKEYPTTVINAPDSFSDNAISTSAPNYTPDVNPQQQAVLKLVDAMSSVESGGNPRAVSPAGAKGLLQVMPQHYARLGVTDPFDPEQSIQAGLTILNEEYQRFGDLSLALAAYNAGSPKVNAAIKKAGSTDFEKVKKYLPAETQKYVPKVMQKLG